MTREELEKDVFRIFGVRMRRSEVLGWEQRERVVIKGQEDVKVGGFLGFFQKTEKHDIIGKQVGVDVIFKNKQNCWVHNPDQTTPYTSEEFDKAFFNV